MKRLSLAIMALTAALITAPAALAEYPESPIRIVVPSAPGGAGDTVVRTLMRVNQDKNIFGVPITVINSPGGGGAVASQQVKAAAADGYTLLALHQGLITANVLGVVDYGPEAFEPVAQVTGQCLVYAASSSAPFATYLELVSHSQAGSRVREAANIGAPAHFASMLLNNAAGAQVDIVQAGQGSERLASLMGGHTDVSIFSVAEALTYTQNGIRPLVILASERDPQLPDVPTAKEVGFDVEFCIGNWLMAPEGTPQSVIDMIVKGLEEIYSDPEVIAEFSARGFQPNLITGSEFESLIAKSTAFISELAADMPQR